MKTLALALALLATSAAYAAPVSGCTPTKARNAVAAGKTAPQEYTDPIIRARLGLAAL